MEPTTILGKDVMQMVRCPVCFLTCSQGIFTCPNGHPTCSKCLRSLSTCPTCRAPMTSKTATRNLLMEQILENVELPCRGADAGCTETPRFCALAQHESSCRFCCDKCDKCGAAVNEGKDASLHRDVCPGATVECPSCRVALRRDALMEHLWSGHTAEAEPWRGVPRVPCARTSGGGSCAASGLLVDRIKRNFVGHRACMVELPMPVAEGTASVGIMVDNVVPRRHRRWHFSFRVGYVLSDRQIDMSMYALGVSLSTSREDEEEMCRDPAHVSLKAGTSVSVHTCTLPLVPYSHLQVSPMSSKAVLVVATPTGMQFNGKSSLNPTLAVSIELSLHDMSLPRATKIRRMDPEGRGEPVEHAAPRGAVWDPAEGEGVPFARYAGDSCIMTYRGDVGMGKEAGGAGDDDAADEGDGDAAAPAGMPPAGGAASSSSPPSGGRALPNFMLGHRRS